MFKDLLNKLKDHVSFVILLVLVFFIKLVIKNELSWQDCLVFLILSSFLMVDKVFSFIAEKNSLKHLRSIEQRIINLEKSTNVSNINSALGKNGQKKRFF